MDAREKEIVMASDILKEKIYFAFRKLFIVARGILQTIIPENPKYSEFFKLLFDSYESN
jgi:hypothetical protein